MQQQASSRTMMMIQIQLLSNRPHRQLPFIVSSSVSMIYGVGISPPHYHIMSERGECERILRKRFGWCEHSFLTLITLLFISLTRVKETNQRKRAWGRTPMSPLYRVLHAKNAVAFFAKHTRSLHCKNFAFAVSKRTAKTEGISTGRNTVGMCCVLPLASS